jgi:hypothetical protein
VTTKSNKDAAAKGPSKGRMIRRGGAVFIPVR